MRHTDRQLTTTGAISHNKLYTINEIYWNDPNKIILPTYEKLLTLRAHCQPSISLAAYAPMM